MHTPRFSARDTFALIALSGLALGCSSTDGLRRSATEPKIRTIASIGDRPIASVTGTPTSSAVADLDPPASRSDTRSRVSGRVLDLDGEPIRGARVRVADGGLPGGRITQATTDKSGGFTLHGLRPGSRYTLIAEHEERGGLVTGRQDVRPPQTDVEIAIQVDDAPVDRRRASKPPTSRNVSDQRDLDEEPLDASPIRLNREDLPPARDGEELPEVSAETSSRNRAGAIPVSKTGWRPGREEKTQVAARPAPEADRSTRRTSAPPDLDDEPTAADPDVNPLPPAIERDDPGPPSRREETSERPRPSRKVSENRTKSPGSPPGALVLAKDPFTLPQASRPQTPAARPAAAPKGPTWSSLEYAWKNPDRLKTTAGPVLAIDELPAIPMVNASSNAVAETCRYDPKQRQIQEFRLPNVDGKSVSLKDFDSDLILIDFWGTWCRPCLSSIPHLVELQKRMGPKRLQVVGIACEEGTATAAAAHVADVARELGINYTVLVSSKDGLSPLQEALKVQAYPTLILIDRQGRIVWRDQGATPTTLARLDRVIDTTARTARIDRPLGGDRRIR